MIRYEWGDPIKKVGGYSFRGKFLGEVTKMDGTPLVVCELDTDAVLHCKCMNCLDPNGDGLVHIFRPDQIEKA